MDCEWAISAEAPPRLKLHLDYWQRERAASMGKGGQRGGPSRGIFNAFGPSQKIMPSRGGAYVVAFDDEDVFVPSNYKGGGKSPWAPQPARVPHGGGKGRHGGKMMYAPPPNQPYQAPAPVRVDMDQVLTQMHEVIHKSVWEAVQEIMEMEKDRTEADLTKRITKYMYKACSDESLLALEWDQMCKTLVKNMFHGYSAACGSAEWFQTINLATALSSAAMVLLPVTGWQVPRDQVFELISVEYHTHLDKITLNKAVWEMCENLFGDDEKVKSKVFGAITRAFDPALARVLNDPTPQADIKRIEAFVKFWIEDSTCRAWGGLHDQAEETLTNESVVQMFDHLLQPFGDQHPFSAIPRVLSEDIGAPPPGWDYLPQVIEQLFENWANAENAPPRKRKKKGGGGDGEDYNPEDMPEDMADEEPEAKPAKKKVANKKVKQEKFSAFKKAKIETDGHPECTSGEDCAGTPENNLVRHVLEEGPGDLYCEVCWKSFTDRNPDLEGIPVEE